MASDFQVMDLPMRAANHLHTPGLQYRASHSRPEQQECFDPQVQVSFQE